MAGLPPSHSVCILKLVSLHIQMSGFSLEFFSLIYLYVYTASVTQF